MKRKFGMRLGSLLLVMLLIVGIFPMSAFADGSEEIAAPVAESTLAAAPAADSSSAAPAASGGEAPASAPAVSGGEAPASAPAASGGEAPAAAPAASGGEAPAAAPAASGGEAPAAAPAASGGEAPAAAPAVSGGEAPASAPAVSGGETPAQEAPATAGTSGEAAEVTAEKASAPAAPAAEAAAPDKAAPEAGQPAEAASVDDKAAAPASDEKAEAKPEADASKGTTAETASVDAPAAVTDTARPALKTASLMLAAPAAETAPDPIDKLSVQITNILKSSGKKDENGHLVPFESNFANLTPGSSKGFTNKNYGSYATRLPYKESDFGVNYDLSGPNLVINNGENAGPVFVSSQEELDAKSASFVSRIGLNRDGTATITYQNGTKETLTLTESTLNVSPVYLVTPQWLLEYNYIDNISTGSGSWSNLDAVTSYTHTFTDPSEKTPVQDYQFRYWEDSETGERYDPSDPDHNSVTFNAASLNSAQRKWSEKEVPNPAGGTWTVPFKETETYAFWQPVAEVDYYANDTLLNSERSFEENGQIKIYDYTPEEIEGAAFEGWYKDSDFTSRYDDEDVLAVPEVTKENGTAQKIAAYARHVIDLLVSKIWDDGDNADNIRPDSVSVDLYSGEGDSRQKVGESVTLSSTNNWSWLFKNLTAFDALGNRIFYSVEETALPNGYTAAVERTDDGFSITNSHTPAPAPAPDPDPAPTPGPNPNPNPGPGPNPNPAPVPALDPDPVPETDPEVEEPEEILSEPVPLVAPVDIIDDPVPQASPDRSWALINLLCALGATLTALCMGFTSMKKDDPSAQPEEAGEPASVMKKSKLLGILPSAASIITFILTEDVRLPMVMTDRWTLLMVVFFLTGLALAWFTRHRRPEEESAASAA